MGRIRDAAGRLWSIVTAPFRLTGRGIRRLGGGVGSTGRFVARQARGTARNFRALLGFLTLDRILPPWIADTIQFYLEATVQATGLRGTSRERTVSAIVTLMLIVTLSTILTFGLTIGLFLVLFVLLGIALIRLVPWINDRWRSNTAGILSRNRDIPGWERD